LCETGRFLVLVFSLQKDARIYTLFPQFRKKVSGLSTRVSSAVMPASYFLTCLGRLSSTFWFKTVRVLLLYDAAFLGLDFMEEIAVGALQKSIFALPSI
jgi:hypothetical protein